MVDAQPYKNKYENKPNRAVTLTNNFVLIYLYFLVSRFFRRVIRDRHSFENTHRYKRLCKAFRRSRASRRSSKISSGRLTRLVLSKSVATILVMRSIMSSCSSWSKACRIDLLTLPCDASISRNLPAYALLTTQADKIENKIIKEKKVVNLTADAMISQDKIAINELLTSAGYFYGALSLNNNVAANRSKDAEQLIELIKKAFATNPFMEDIDLKKEAAKYLTAI